MQPSLYKNSDSQKKTEFTRVLKLYNLKESFEYCAIIAKQHYENFPVASIAIPKNLRPYVAAVYAFSRVADDFADEKIHEGNRMEKLTDWSDRLKNLFLKEPLHPIFIALKETIKKFDIPVTLFENLLVAFKTDVVKTRYARFHELLKYCDNSANPVGRIVLHIFGYPAPKFMEYSDAICTGLQLANFWQDIAVDLEKDRIYLPTEDMSQFRYSEEDLKNRIYNEEFRRLILFQVDRTREFFNQGKILCTKIPGRLGLELRLTWLGGMKILEKIEKVQGDVFNHRPTLTKKDAIGMLWRGFRKKSFQKLL